MELREELELAPGVGQFSDAAPFEAPRSTRSSDFDCCWHERSCGAVRIVHEHAAVPTGAGYTSHRPPSTLGTAESNRFSVAKPKRREGVVALHGLVAEDTSLESLHSRDPLLWLGGLELQVISHLGMRQDEQSLIVDRAMHHLCNIVGF